MPLFIGSPSELRDYKLSMSGLIQISHYNKTLRVWSDKREKEISMKVYFSVRWQDGCKIIDINNFFESC